MTDIIDNKNIKLVDVLKEKLSMSKRARFCVGWLFLSGFKELKEEIDRLEKLEILAGSRTNKQTAELMFLEKKWDKAVKDALEKTKYLPEDERRKILDEEFRELINDLSYIRPTQENIEFLKWFLMKLEERRIEIRIYYKEPLHAKLYLFEYKNQSHGKGEAIVGSSNFSISGFELNTELNVRVEGDDKFEIFSQWFENLWKASETTDFTNLAQQAIENSWAFNRKVTPFRVYLRVLHEIFSFKEPESEIEIEGDLYRFQKDAVIDAYRRLKKFNGVFISDVPGLGKTYIGAALLSHLETEGQKAVAIVPPRLVESWEEVLKDFGASKTEVFSYGKLEEILENEKYMKKQIVLIDESHHFRNPDTKRYRDLAKICEGKTVILVTATPQNLSIWDIYWQIKLFTPYEAYHNFRIYPIKLKDYFKACEDGKANIENLIAQLFIRRTRSDIKEYYPDEKIFFPKRMGPYRVDYSIDEVYEGGLYQKLKELINKLTYARYNLGKYAKAKEFIPDEFQRLNVAWTNLQRLIKINLYRRLESSVQAFKDSVETHLKAHEFFRQVLIKENKIWVGDIDELEEYIEKLQNDEEIEWRETRNFYDPKKFYIRQLKEDLENDIKVFKEMQELVKDITPEDDDKLQKLIEILNRQPIKGKKTLIFSCFESTVKYLYENLKDKFERVDYIAGGRDVLRKIKHFAPRANKDLKIPFDPKKEIQILITTEILSEGLNLHDGQVVINYELHWNPVRIIQRVGRIDRIWRRGEKPLHREIYIYNFFPETRAEKEIRIEEKVNNRIDEIISNFGYDQKTIRLDEKTVRKKLFEIYTEKPEGIEEIEEKSASKYFEYEFNVLKNKYPEEYQIAINLPTMINIAREHKNKGIIVFCRRGDYYGSRLINHNGEIISCDDWEALKLLRCSIDEKGEKFNEKYFSIIEKAKEDFENEANGREKDKQEITDPVKKELEKLIKWFKRKESREIEERFDKLFDFVKGKQLSHEQSKSLRRIVRNYKKKFGLKKEEILEELESKIYPLLKDAPPLVMPQIEPKYTHVIIAEELK